MNQPWTADLAAWVRSGWGQQLRSTSPTDAGMNSRTTVVELDQGTYVAKLVPHAQARAFGAGLAIALTVSAGGVPSGEVLPTSDGQLTHLTPQGPLALLALVPGRTLRAESGHDQALMATTLARVHGVEDTAGAPPFSPGLSGLVHDVEPWVRPAVEAVATEYEQLPALTHGLIHGDPVTDAFRHDPVTGRTGLIDWGGASHGPLLYDVASALMYLGGPGPGQRFWRTYCEHSPAPSTELVQHVAAFHRLRGAVQAAYFSKRVATHDLTGIATQAENLKGLHDARRMLERHGVSAAARGSSGSHPGLRRPAGDPGSNLG